MRRHTNPVEVGLGIGLLILAATAPTQIVLASSADSPGWVTAVAAGSSAVAAVGALGAAYYASRQADQIGRSRLAEHVLPALEKLRDLNEDVRKTLVHIDALNPASEGLANDTERKAIAIQAGRHLPDLFEELGRLGSEYRFPAQLVDAANQTLSRQASTFGAGLRLFAHEASAALNDENDLQRALESIKGGDPSLGERCAALDRRIQRMMSLMIR